MLAWHVVARQTVAGPRQRFERPADAVSTRAGRGRQEVVGLLPGYRKGHDPELYDPQGRTCYRETIV